MKVFVIMGNDFPAAVVANQAAADALIAKREKEEREELIRHHGEKLGKLYGPRIHWRSYEFELQSATTPAPTEWR